MQDKHEPSQDEIDAEQSGADWQLAMELAGGAP